MPYKNEKEVPLDDAIKRRDTKDEVMVANSIKTCLEAVQGLRPDLLSDILKDVKPKTISDRDGDDSGQVYDRFTNADWRYINQNCHLVAREGMIRVNEAKKSAKVVPYVFSAFCPPG